MNNCSTIQEYSSESIDLFEIQCLFTVLYTLLCIMAIVGNTLVLYVVSINQVSLNVRSIFIGCLAVSDLVMSLTSLPITAITIFTRVWVFPSVFCKLIGIFQGGSIFVSSFTLTVIAVDRCLLIVKPNREIISYSRSIGIIIGIWVLGYSMALPTGVFSSEQEYQGICGKFCEENWPDLRDGVSLQRKSYGMSVMLLQFGIPAVICSMCYCVISRVMDTQLERRRGHTLLPESEMKLVSRKSRANRMMVAMVLGFMFAWMPLNLINLYRDLTAFTVTKWFSTVFAFCHVCAMMSAVLNPVIYSWFNPQFRSAIQQIWQAKRKHSAFAQMKSTAATDLPSRSDRKKSCILVAANGKETHQPGDQLL